MLEVFKMNPVMVNSQRFGVWSAKFRFHELVLSAMGNLRCELPVKVVA
jgi:hypothetical protein